MATTLDEAEAAFRATLDDLRLSRTEKRALSELIPASTLTDHKRSALRDRAFAVASDALSDPDGKLVVTWLKDLINVLEKGAMQPAAVAEARFSPGPACRDKIGGLLNNAKKSVDICVFTITDNALKRVILDTHGRGVDVRIITDDEKSEDRGSDIQELRSRGIPVRFDNDPSHMHHKFALFDRALLLTGSYNWTRSAAAENRENILVTDDGRLVQRFRDEFESLWNKFGR